MPPQRHIIVVVFIGTCALALLGCDNRKAEHAATELTAGGQPHKGVQLIRYYGCSSCHTIPGIHGATALVGPPLEGVAARSYIGGVMPNTPQNMIHWIQNPKAADEKTAMPNLHVTEADARDIASYLYTLR